MTKQICLCHRTTFELLSSRRNETRFSHLFAEPFECQSLMWGHAAKINANSPKTRRTERNRSRRGACGRGVSVLLWSPPVPFQSFSFIPQWLYTIWKKVVKNTTKQFWGLMLSEPVMLSSRVLYKSTRTLKTNTHVGFTLRVLLHNFKHSVRTIFLPSQSV